MFAEFEFVDGGAAERGDRVGEVGRKTWKLRGALDRINGMIRRQWEASLDRIDKIIRRQWKGCEESVRSYVIELGVESF